MTEAGDALAGVEGLIEQQPEPGTEAEAGDAHAHEHALGCSPNVDDWSAFAKAVCSTHGAQPVRARAVYPLAREHLQALTANRTEHGAKTALGKALADRSGERFNGVRLEVAGRDRHAKVTTYRFRREPSTPERLRSAWACVWSWLGSVLPSREVREE